MKRTDLTIRYLTQEEFHLWNDYVTSHPDGSVFHTTVFLEAVSKPVKRALKVLCLFKGSEIIGGLAFGSIKKAGFNIIPLPYECPVFHPLITERASKFVSKKESFINTTLTLLLQQLKKEYDAFSFVFSPNVKDLRPYRWNGLNLEVNYTYLNNIKKINLENPDFAPSTKRQIAKAVKQNYSISKGFSNENIDAFYSLLQQTYTRKDIVFKMDKKALLRLFRNLSDRNWLEIFVLQFEGQAAAACAITTFNQTAHYWMAASDSHLSKLGAPSALLVEVMKWLKTREIEIFDLVGANIQSVSNFKAGFNFELDYKNTASYHPFIYKFILWMKQLARHISRIFSFLL
jgi:lipid II:glycine glycyltransferase (peptidoglycan interpeptide bridge formation enzyme)